MRADHVSALNYKDASRAPRIEERRRIVRILEEKCGSSPTVFSSCTEIADWLQLQDPDGFHAHVVVADEGGEPYTIATAWERLALIADEQETEDITGAEPPR